MAKGAMLLAALLPLAPDTGLAARTMPAGGRVTVAPTGETRIVGGVGGTGVLVSLVTRPASAAEAAGGISRCSGGRVACSLVDRLRISIDGRSVEVPPRAVLLLSDLDDARLLTLGRGRFELVLTGGDAAPAYQARIFFDRRRVDRMDLWSDEAGVVEQSTRYADLSKAFR